MNSAITQGFTWEKQVYHDKKNGKFVELDFTEETYQVLLQRYIEIPTGGESGPPNPTDPEIDFNYSILEEGSKIDYDFMNRNFDKYMKKLFDENATVEEIETLKASLHKNFASLPQDRQEIADMIINDLENGDLKIVDDWDFNQYINAYSISELDKQLDALVNFTGVDKEKVKDLLNLRLTDKNLNEYGRYDALKNTVNDDLVLRNLTRLKGEEVPKFKAKFYVDKLLRKFILEEPFNINDYNQYYKNKI